MEDSPEANVVRTLEDGLGKVLKSAREGRGFSQESVARQMAEFGHSWRQTTVAKTEAGQRPIRVNEVASLAMVLSFPVESLISEANDASQAHQDVVYWQAKRKSILDRMVDLSKQLDGLSQDLGHAEESLETAWRRWKGESPLTKYGGRLHSSDLSDRWRIKLQALLNRESPGE